ncbi:GNAT family N-acetyltransferase [Rouxiella sp. Mn2063]|uniref:GNAT family N-acetyltransferase n=1 Tax=Rouxiella sp. Mn2063 TaxID=3395262 RepID=UPI003BDFB2D8
MFKINILNTQTYLKILSPVDTVTVEQYFHTNAAHLAPWEPLRSEDFYSTPQIRQRLNNMLADAQQGVAFQFGIFAQPSDEMIGACNFTGVARGPFQACHLGYSLAQHAQGKGVMTLALQAGIHFMFTEQKLHRIMASYIPHNVKSEQVLQRLGFGQEGYAKSYLKIAGKWQDHILTSLINPQDLES